MVIKHLNFKSICSTLEEPHRVWNWKNFLTPKAWSWTSSSIVCSVRSTIREKIKTIGVTIVTFSDFARAQDLLVKHTELIRVWPVLWQCHYLFQDFTVLSAHRSLRFVCTGIWWRLFTIQVTIQVYFTENRVNRVKDALASGLHKLAKINQEFRVALFRANDENRKINLQTKQVYNRITIKLIAHTVAISNWLQLDLSVSRGRGIPKCSLAGWSSLIERHFFDLQVDRLIAVSNSKLHSLLTPRPP